MKHWWSEDGKNRSTGRITVLVPLCLPRFYLGPSPWKQRKAEREQRTSCTSPWRGVELGEGKITQENV